MKQNKPIRRSLNDRINAELESAEEIPLAGMQSSTSSSASSVVPKPSRVEVLTKKATTIMPKELFIVLQDYCAHNDLPKHRAITRFILDGLHAAGQLDDKEYQRFKDMADKITTTYEKHK